AALLLCLLAPAAAQVTVPTINPERNPEGLIHLDVTVTGESGQPVLGLPPGTFTLFDNGHPEPLVSVTASRADEPFTVIVLFDTMGMEKPAVAVARDSVERFLRSNAGHLDEPVGIYALGDSEFGLLAQPSRDGNALASAVARNKLIRVLFRPPVTE